MRTKLAPLLGVALVAAALGAPPSPTRGLTTPPYTIRDLGTLPGDYASVAMGINERGDVVGWSAGPTGTRAFIFTSESGMAALPALAGRPVTAARAINENAVVVGTASVGGTDPGHAVRWQAGVAHDLGTLGTGSSSEARGVNDTGAIVGSSGTDGGGLLGTHAFSFTDASGMVDLTPGYDSGHAEAISGDGAIAGWRNGRAFRLSGGTFTDLGVPVDYAYSFAFAINDAGQVAGHVVSPTGNRERIFRYSGGQMELIGGLGEYNRAMGINAAGDVVGVGLPVLGLLQGFLYTDADGMRGLNQLIDPDSGWYILGAGGINDAGQIVGWASGPNGQRAVLLTPTADQPPPPPPPPVATAPAPPSDLAGTALSDARIRLTWTDGADNELGFRIQRVRGSGGDWVRIGSVAADVTRFTDRTAVAGRLYRYRVRAYNDAGTSPWSNRVRIRAIP